MITYRKVPSDLKKTVRNPIMPTEFFVLHVCAFLVFLVSLSCHPVAMPREDVYIHSSRKNVNAAIDFCDDMRSRL